MAQHRLSTAAALILLGLPAAASAQDVSTYDANGDGRLDVQILYDSTGPYAELGAIYSEMLMNLLGHFPSVDAWAVSTGEYQAGDLLANELTFYIGSTYDEAMPQAMIDDFWVTDRPIVWMGYNLWKIGWADWNSFILEYGFQHWYIAGNDGAGENTDFYRYVQYKGKELPKFAWWNATASTFVNDPFLNVLYVDDPTKIQVIAESVHSGSGDVQPYIARSGNLTVVNDMPFTFIHEQDRYLAFADALHDMVGIDHPSTKKALFRLEDMHPLVAPADLRSVTNVLKEGRTRPWTIALVPTYEDPLGYYNGGVPVSVNMNAGAARAWRTQVTRARSYGAKFSLHGLSHQFSNIPNPYSGVTGDDFEFWDAVNDRPVAGDTYARFKSRIQTAQTLMGRQSWTAFAWQAPHYRMSVSNYLWTNDFYATTWHRIVYQPFTVQLWGTTYSFNEIWNNPQSVSNWSAATVGVAGDRWGGQFFPYMIHRDVHGNRVLPENLGNIEPAEFALGPQYVRLVSDLLANADKNLVNRCAFASFFYHPYLMQFPELSGAGGQEALRALITGIEAMGYTFVDASAL